VNEKILGESTETHHEPTSAHEKGGKYFCSSAQFSGALMRARQRQP
jgi:hypothetical protein